MDELDILFNEALTENNIFPDQPSLAEKIIINAEREFKGLGGEEEDRQDEEKSINEKIKNLELQLHKTKNIKNHKLIHLNAKRAEKRKDIKRDITELRMRLYDIN